MADLRSVASHIPSTASVPSARPTPRTVTPSQRPTDPSSDVNPLQRAPHGRPPAGIADAIGRNVDVRA